MRGAQFGIELNGSGAVEAPTSLFAAHRVMQFRPELSFLRG